MSVLIGKVGGLAVSAAVFYFRLGYAIPLALAIGAVLALVLTRHELRTFKRPVLAAIGAMTVYCALTICVFAVLTNQVSRSTFAMAWHDAGSQNRLREPEVVLEFVDFPGNAVGMYSTELRDGLIALGKQRVDVEFEVTRDLWCVRGFHEVRIGSLTSWNYADAYASSSGSPASPWGPKAWWCP